jgi:hypothetical protein
MAVVLATVDPDRLERRIHDPILLDSESLVELSLDALVRSLVERGSAWKATA